MALTTMDAVPALIVIDLQQGILAAPTAHPAKNIVHNAAELAAAFRGHGLPVVLVTVTGGARGRTDANPNHARPANFSLPPNWADPAPGLDPQPTDHRVAKQRWGAFHDTDLHTYLSECQVTQVVLAGIATSGGVESTARAAHEHGYHVVLATDAMTDSDAEAHNNSVDRVFPRLGETTTTGEIIAMLDKTR
ncbi:isochorismatase family protein [Kutzneria sp. CA-103260]|uniref:isochorismatase family protein n=1 Tax=Kutzneria sp. CA-103260 TaxID=2802641 RepID=UPI001BAD5412|nr:isochorismatase family protein [Kutzneria sp. CA-103260]QUQ67122.1 hydrolase [Kutzneria sp. CA-103260]